MLIRRTEAIKLSEITSPDLFLRRREFLRGAGLVAAGAALAPTLACGAEGEGPPLAPAAAAERLVAEHREVVLADPNTSFLVAEEQGEVLGFLHAQIEQGDPIYALERYGTIVDLFVLELRRGEGIGEQLLQSCLEWFRSLNLQEYRVSTPVHTPEAQRFLEKHGALPLFVVQAAPLGDEE